MKDEECEYDEIIPDKHMVKNIKKKSTESYATHINRLLDEYNDDKA
jgi:hypothetical protein